MTESLGPIITIAVGRVLHHYHHQVIMCDRTAATPCGPSPVRARISSSSPTIRHRDPLG
jgi:hypothetical protein